MRPLRPENDRLLEVLEPFVVATAANRARFDLRPFGLELREDRIFDPLHTRSAGLLERLGRLDVVTFGPEGMPMPRWVFLDGAELPGGIFGFGCEAEDLPDGGRALFELDAAATGFVPLSMFIAIPTHQPRTWVGHNLASAAPQLPAAGYKGLASLTKAVGLAVYRAEHQIGVTQWNSLALAVHTRLGPLELLTAWTPAHSEPWSLTYRARITEAALRNLAREPGATVSRPEPTRWIDSEDHAAMRALQDEIEAGARYVVAGRPEVLAAEHLRVPVAPAGLFV